jgi:hypothetical protein
MDLLGDYEESDEEISPMETKATMTLVKNQTAAVGNVAKSKKKKKKLDISFLPENIQAALARGDTAGDSDSDQEDTSIISHTVSHETSSALELLSKLPKPKTSSKSTTELGIPKKKHEILVSKFEAESKTIDNVKSPISLPQTVHIIDSDSDSDVDDISVISKAHSSIPTNYFVSPPLEDISPPTLASSVFTEPPMTLPSFDYSTPTHNPLYSSVFNPYQPTISSTTTSTSSLAATSLPQQNKISKNNFRKRDREIESSLLRGDTSLLDSNSSELLTGSDDLNSRAQFIDVQHNHEWNADYYYNQQKRQKELQTIFNFKQNGGDKMLSQPTKLQNRRHQINSLVMSAAESEFELLEAKGRQMKTKYETQSKYGW